MGPGAAVATALYTKIASDVSSAEPALRPSAFEPASTGPSWSHPWKAVLLDGDLARGGELHSIIEAALRGKLGLGPAAKELNMQADAGELYLVDNSLLQQIDEIRAMDARVRREQRVREGRGWSCIAWVYIARSGLR
uniref:Uncharacterized protein n=1 Tax=Coccolithus braarudii TaxID=221442 RepID=A0A7S0Q3C5_9EUKA|mmetsp:Transcript_43345/g.92273  ORF Transcript_43345/g.92273 Transcript_43345/m.92273 type:complete len:137 (+) Transcript_43345:3-413(+)